MTDKEADTARLVCLGTSIAYDDKRKRSVRHRYCPEEVAHLAGAGEASIYKHEILLAKPLCNGARGFDTPGSVYEGEHKGLRSFYCGEWRWVGRVEDDETRNVIQAIAEARRREVDLLNYEKRAANEDGLAELVGPLREAYMGCGGGRARTVLLNRIVSLITGVARR